MFEAIIQFSISSLVVVLSGVALSRFTDKIAEVTKLGKVFTGAVLLAAATSLPELSVSVSAVQQELYDIGVGNLVGSCLFNLLILASLDFTTKPRGKIFKQSTSTFAFTSITNVLLTAGLGLFIVTNLKFSIGPLGIGSLFVLVTYLFTLRLVYTNEVYTHQQKTEIKNFKNPKLIKAGIGYLVAATLIFFAAPFVAKSAGQIASLTKLSDSFVGTTLVAFATSLPEVVTTLAAVRLGQIGLAVGNVIGSNSFNIFLVVPADLFSEVNLLASVSPIHTFTCFASIFITSMIAMSHMFPQERKMTAKGVEAGVVILLIVSALTLIYFQ